MTIHSLYVTSLVCQAAATLLAIRLNWTCGKRGAWLVIAAALLLTTIRSAYSIRHHAGTDLSYPLLTAGTSLLLFCGMVLIERTFRGSKQAEDALRREKRDLTMLVDRRFADLESEVAERKRAEEALRKDSERFGAIISTQTDIAMAELDLDSVMDLIVERTQKLTEASGAIIELVEGEELVYRAASGRAAPYIGLRTKIAMTLSGECVRTGTILRCNDAERDTRVDLDACRRVGARSMIVVPLHYNRQVIGVLQVVSPELFAFDAMDAHTLQLMAGLIAAAMSHTAEFAAKQTMLTEALDRSERDPLTGELNHRAFHRRLHEEADRAQQEGSFLTVAVADMNNFKFFNDVYGHTVGDDVLRQVANALKSCCRNYDTLARYGGDEFALLMPGLSLEDAEQMRERLAACLDGVGYQPPDYDTVIPLSITIGVATFPAEAPTRIEALELADARLRRAKTGGDEHADQLRRQLSSSVEGFSMLDALVTAVDTKDRYTHSHCEDVLTYSLEIAQELNLDEQTQDIVAIAALLHDVGKIGVPDNILRKPGRLTEDEFGAIKQHPVMGAVIVGAVPGFEKTLDAIHYHHERWDGNGYPAGLRELEIPQMARLMAVADAYSAMTTDRPYRKGMDPTIALKIIEEGAGTQWDPVCVQAFLSVRQRTLVTAFAERMKEQRGLLSAQAA